MRYRRLKLDRRGDISSPIIVILVTVAALAVAGMAIAWMASTGSRASSQGSLVVVGTPSVSGNNLYITLKNMGNADVTLSNVTLSTGGTSPTYYYATAFNPSSTVTAGSSAGITVTLTASPTSGAVLLGSLLTSQGTIQFSANVQ
jgi:hypothetical protein